MGEALFPSEKGKQSEPKKKKKEARLCLYPFIITQLGFY